VNSLSNKDNLPEKFIDDVTDSNWVMYISWDYEENIPKSYVVSNTPPKGEAVGEDDFMFTIRVSESVKDQIHKFDVVMDELNRPYLTLKENEEYKYPSDLDRELAEARRRLQLLERKKISQDGKL